MICHGGGSDGHAASFNGSPPSALYSGLLEEIYHKVYLSITKIKFIKFRKQEESLEVIVHQTHSPAQCWLNIKLKTPAFQWDGMLEEWLEWRNYYLASFIYRNCAVSVLTMAATLDIFVRNDERKIKSEPPTGFSSKNYTTPPSFPSLFPVCKLTVCKPTICQPLTYIATEEFVEVLLLLWLTLQKPVFLCKTASLTHHPAHWGGRHNKNRNVNILL